MARKSDVPSRGEITDTIGKHKDDMSEKIESLDSISEDAVTVQETLESLNFEGTSEGTDEVQSSIEKAEEVTLECFDNEDQNLEEIQDASQEYEIGLQERVDSGESDIEMISDAVSRITTADTHGELEQAQTSIQEDLNFLSDQNEAARIAREENEQHQQECHSRIQR